MWTIGNSRGAPIRGLLGPWDAFAHWRALGLSLLAVQSATPTECFHVVVSSSGVRRLRGSKVEGLLPGLRRFNSPKKVRERSRQPFPIWAPQTRTHSRIQNYGFNTLLSTIVSFPHSFWASISIRKYSPVDHAIAKSL